MLNVALIGEMAVTNSISSSSGVGSALVRWLGPLAPPESGAMITSDDDPWIILGCSGVEIYKARQAAADFP